MANCGVPAKPSLKALGAVFKALKSRCGSAGRTYPGRRRARRRCANFASRRSLFALFFEAPANQLTLEFGKVVDEQLAVEMVHLVLKANGQKAVGVNFKRISVTSQRADTDMRSPLHLVIDVGHRQTTFFARTASLGTQEFRIDKNHGLIALLAHVENEQSPMHIHLSGGE